MNTIDKNTNAQNKKVQMVELNRLRLSNDTAFMLSNILTRTRIHEIESVGYTTFTTVEILEFSKAPSLFKEVIKNDILTEIKKLYNVVAGEQFVYISKPTLLKRLWLNIRY